MGKTGDPSHQAEDDFYALLHRVQRQPTPTGSSNAVIPSTASRQKRPPDEASNSMGRNLALKFRATGFSRKTKNNSNEAGDPKALSSLPIVPVGVQERAIQCLVDPQVNSAVVVSFLQTLVSPRGGKPLVQMEWLPTWILHAESVVVQEEREPTYHSLSSLIRTLGHYHLWCHREQLQQQSGSAARRGLTAGKNSRIETLQDVFGTTYRRCKSSMTRRMMIREWVTIAFGYTTAVPFNASTTMTVGGDDGGSSVTSAVSSTTGLSKWRNGSTVSSGQLVQRLLSPLLAASVLTLDTPISETALFMEMLWNGCWSEMTNWCHQDLGGQQDFLEMLEWLTQALNMVLWGIPCYTKNGGRSFQAALEQLTASKDLANRWLLQMLELASDLSLSLQQDESGDYDPLPAEALLDHGTGVHERLASWLSRITAGTIPRLVAIVPSYHVPMEPALVHILQILQRLSHQHLYPSPKETVDVDWNQKPRDVEFLDDVSTLRVATFILSNPIPGEVILLMRILHVMTTSRKTGTASVTRLAMLRGLANMLLRREGCEETCKALLQFLHSDSTLNQRYLYSTIKKVNLTRLSPEKAFNCIQFLDDAMFDVNEFVRFLVGVNSIQGTEFTPMQQTGALMFGIGLLLDDSIPQNDAYTFFKYLLGTYPHLGVSLLPVSVSIINVSCSKGRAGELERQLDFLSGVIVLDPHCASEVWNLLGIQLMTETTPSAIRAMIIRLFPRMVHANKRLYRRVLEVMRIQLAMSSHNVELRVAVAASIADLAKEDAIRDVMDVIGIIQSFITDISWIHSVSTLDIENSGSNAALVHYAILALHYLLVAQELDFKLVISVLSKRLCNIDDMNELNMLPPIVLESLTLLLGDGEADSGNDEKALQPSGVPYHVSKSVSTLIDLASSSKLRLVPDSQDRLHRVTLLRCKKHILHTLAAYSSEALAIDDVGLRALTGSSGDHETPAFPPSAERYQALRQIVQDGIQVMGSGLDILDTSGLQSKTSPSHSTTDVAASDISVSLVALVSRMLAFEEDVLGSSIWQKRGSSRKGASFSRPRASGHTSPDQVPTDTLPTVARVRQVYDGNRCDSTALAALLCFEGKPVSLLRDIAAVMTNGSGDAFMQTFSLQAWLNAARRTLGDLIFSYSSSDGLDNLLENVRAWRFQLGSPDSMYLALSSMAILIPEMLGLYGDHSKYVKEIYDEVWNAFSEDEFENEDVGRLCIALVGVSVARGGASTQDLLNDTMDALERSVSGYGGRASFGAYYGLALVCQACQNATVKDGGHSLSSAAIAARIVGFLMKELISCVAGKYGCLARLVDCIKEARFAPDLIDELTALGKKSVKIIKSKIEVAKLLFIALALCLPSLAVVNDELLLGAYCFLDALPWGFGKGLALSSVLRACKTCGLFQTREIEKIYAAYGAMFKEGIEKGASGLDDIFYAVAATTTKAVPSSIRQYLVTADVLDEDGRILALLGSLASLGSIPCLGHGAASATESAQLSAWVSNEDVVGVNALVSEAITAKSWTKYPQMAVVVLGFLASLNTAPDVDESITVHSRSSRGETSSSNGPDLPRAQEGTILEVVITALQQQLSEAPNNLEVGSTNLVVSLLGCLEAVSLPGQFAGFLENLFCNNTAITTAATKLLFSQIRGRPRAVFDGKEYVELALKISKQPALLGRGDAPSLFVEALVFLVPKFSSDAMGEVLETFWRLCSNLMVNLPDMTITFLFALKGLLKASTTKKPVRLSPKSISFLHHFLMTRVFAGIRDVPVAASSNVSTIGGMSVVEAYVDCLWNIPVSTLIDANFFAPSELDGFAGEALRYRCTLLLVQNSYFETASRAFSEVSAAVAWFSRQLTSSEEEVFSSSLLLVACSIADATAIVPANSRKELLLTLFDNLLLTGSSSSYVGLQLLGVLLCRWTKGEGSDGDLSLACLISTQVNRWKELCPPSLQQIFRIMVHDLPFNLASYSRAENMTGVVFNRLWRLFNKWSETGTGTETLECIRRALICCRPVDVSNEEFSSMATSMLS